VNTEISTSELIALAWCDKTSWTSIHAQTGFTEDQVMKIMKENLRSRSYIVWRKRVKKHKPQ